ncbi:MAG: class IV adenylate cyclase [Candidatus Heimdallarchaeota archaeon]
MIEIEVKVRVREPERIKNCLDLLGYEFLKKEHQEDTYFKSSFRSFKETREILRVRKQIPGSDVVTFKRPKLRSEIKAREEIEVNIDNSSEVIKLLTALGYEPWITVEKEREIYRFDKFTISLDKVKDLGHFMEIEAKIEETQSKLEVEQEIFNLLNRIGISKNLIAGRSYFELILEKHKNASM